MSWRDSSLNSGTCLSSSSLWSIGAISPSRMVMTAVGSAQHTAPASRHRDRPHAYTWRRPFRTLTRTTSDAREPHARASFGSRERPPRRQPRRPAQPPPAALPDAPDRAGARAMLKAIGFTDEDLAKPLVGVATTWIETMPCNYNQGRLADCVKEGIQAGAGTPMEFNTISVSDGVTMGTEGMKASLISREVIADSIELVVRGHLLDGLVCLTGCDKTMPGAAMAMARLDVPSLALYNGTIYPGMYKGRTVDVVSVYEAIGAYRAGKISLDE